MRRSISTRVARYEPDGFAVRSKHIRQYPLLRKGPTFEQQRIGISRFDSTVLFIRRFVSIHGDKFDECPRFARYKSVTLGVNSGVERF